MIYKNMVRNPSQFKHTKFVILVNHCVTFTKQRDSCF